MLAVSKVPYPMKFGPDQTYHAYCGLWRTEDGFDLAVQIKSELIAAPIDVTPILYLKAGAEVVLPPVHVAAAGADEVDVNEALLFRILARTDSLVYGCKSITVNGK